MERQLEELDDAWAAANYAWLLSVQHSLPGLLAAESSEDRNE